jgi:hypothetical protein
MDVVITPPARIYVLEASVHESTRAITQLFRHLLGLVPESTAQQMDQAHDVTPLLSDLIVSSRWMHPVNGQETFQVNLSAV